MYPDHGPRRLLAILSIAGIILLSGCADTRGGSIPYDRPLAAPDEVLMIPQGSVEDQDADPARADA